MSHQYSFRKMLPSDKEDILKISAKIWGGYDHFIPMYFDDWVKETKGEFVAILHKDQLVGCGKLSFLTDTDAWLQGLRKDIDLPIKGVALAATKYFIEKLKSYDNLTSIRFSSYVDEPGSFIAAEKVGFKCIKRMSLKFIWFKPEDVQKNPQSRVAKIDNTTRILEYIKKSGFHKHMDGFINLDWTSYPYSDSLIENQFVKTGQCFGIEEDGEIKSLALVHFGRSMNLSFIDADDILHLRELIEYLKPKAVESNWDGIQLFIGKYDKLRCLIDELGFHSWQKENDFLLYEFPLELLRD